jgi:hypothetical protein
MTSIAHRRESVDMNILKSTLIVSSIALLASLGTAQAETPSVSTAQEEHSVHQDMTPILVAGRDGLDRFRDFYDSIEAHRACIS